MVQLNRGQRQLLADILGNTAVGWLVVGAVAPIFDLGLHVEIKVLSIIVGIIVFLFFVGLAIYTLQK